jgi:hypothetical protein
MGDEAMARRVFVLFAAAMSLPGPPALAQKTPAQPQGPQAVTRNTYAGTIQTNFARMDSNHDGTITKAELGAEQQRELDLVKSRLTQQMLAKFKQLDTNKDGQLTFQEFAAATPPLKAAETTDEMLQSLDPNHDGKITLAEFRAIQLGRFDKADTNHDGTVTAAEARAAQQK